MICPSCSRRLASVYSGFLPDPKPPEAGKVGGVHIPQENSKMQPFRRALHRRTCVSVLLSKAKMNSFAHAIFATYMRPRVACSIIGHHRVVKLGIVCHCANLALGIWSSKSVFLHSTVWAASMRLCGDHTIECADRTCLNSLRCTYSESCIARSETMRAMG